MDPWSPHSPPQPPRRRGLSDRSRAYLAAVVALLAACCVMMLDPGNAGSRFRSLVGLDQRPVEAVPFSGEGTYRFFATQPASERPVAWNPCRPIRYAVNPEGAPSGWDVLVDRSVAEVAEAAGLRFEYVGTTGDRDFEDRGARREQPVLIGWADEEEVPALADEVAGLGGPVSSSVAGYGRYVGGMVVLDTDAYDDLASQPGGSLQQQAILMHELGHLLGLDHVDDPGELMYESNVGRTTFGPGDLTGLAILGSVPCG